MVTKCALDYRNTTEATVNYYGVDLELLFSKAPFAREDLQRMAMVRPKLSQQLQLEENAGSQEFLIDSDLQTQTLLVEVESGAAFYCLVLWRRFSDLCF